MKRYYRKSIRLKGYDYSQAGAYFITICVNGKRCLFGRIENERMILNDAGNMIDKWLHKVPEKFPDIVLTECQIMPNHFHVIVVNTGQNILSSDTNLLLSEHKGSPLYEVVRWFKTMATNEYIRNVKTNNWEPFNKRLFQRNYWEHIIRSEQSYNAIAEYIVNNPAKWNNDQLFSS